MAVEIARFIHKKPNGAFGAFGAFGASKTVPLVPFLGYARVFYILKKFTPNQRYVQVQSNIWRPFFLFYVQRSKSAPTARRWSTYFALRFFFFVSQPKR